MSIISQMSLGSTPKQGDRIIASEDETVDTEAPFIQKVFGIMRIYYALVESVKMVFPRKWILESRFFSQQHDARDPLSSSDRQRSSESRKSSGMPDKRWLKQLRKMAKTSYGKGIADNCSPFDPSLSRTRSNRFWNTERSGSSS